MKTTHQNACLEFWKKSNERLQKDLQDLQQDFNRVKDSPTLFITVQLDTKLLQECQPRLEDCALIEPGRLQFLNSSRDIIQARSDFFLFNSHAVAVSACGHFHFMDFSRLFS